MPSDERPALPDSVDAAVTDCRLLGDRRPTSSASKIREWFPMAMHLLEGLTIGMRSSQAVVGQRERLLSLGRLSAGLTHELNNPAAAAVRATASLRERVAGMRHKLAQLADRQGRRRRPCRRWSSCRRTAVERMAKAQELTPMEVSDAEDALGDWLDDHDVTDGWDLAPALVGGRGRRRLAGRGRRQGARRSCSTAIALGRVRPGDRAADERDRGRHPPDLDAGRRGQAVLADGPGRAPGHRRHGRPEQHAGHARPQDQGGGRSPWSRTSPTTCRTVPAHPAELNQVWTNLIDNALQAMPDGGTLTVRTALEDDHVLVEIGDTGAGIPAELQQQIFEPFFTTKPVGEGTGLGPGHLLPGGRPAARRRPAGAVPAGRHPVPGAAAAGQPRAGHGRALETASLRPCQSARPR